MEPQGRFIINDIDFKAEIDIVNGLIKLDALYKEKTYNFLFREINKIDLNDWWNSITIENNTFDINLYMDEGISITVYAVENNLINTKYYNTVENIEISNLEIIQSNITKQYIKKYPYLKNIPNPISIKCRHYISNNIFELEVSYQNGKNYLITEIIHYKFITETIKIIENIL
jgi:hypothetical protein